MEKEFLDGLSDILETNEPITMKDDFRQYDSWGSLAYLLIVAMIDEKYNLTIPRNDFLKMKTVSDLYKYILKHNK